MEAKRQKRLRAPRGAIALGVAGLLLCAYALWGIFSVPHLTQYVTLPGTGSFLARVDAWDEQRKAQQSALYGASLYTASYNAHLTGDESVDATLFGVDEGFFEAHPKYIIDGHLFDSERLKIGAKDLVIDENLSIKLFPGGAPLGRKVSINEKEYRVVGIINSDHVVGDFDEYTAYAPLRAVNADAIPITILVADCVTNTASQSRTLDEISRAALGDEGQLYSVSKEIMRATMILRLLLILFGFFFLFRILKLVNQRLKKRLTGYREELQVTYLRDMLKRIGFSLVKFIACYTAIAAAGAGLLSLIIQPMYVFTEWVPDIIVEWTSVASRAGALIVDYARPVSAETREMASINFYALMLRWGVLAIMSGAIMLLWNAFARGREEARIQK